MGERASLRGASAGLWRPLLRMVFGAALLASGCIGTMDRTEGETRAEPVDVTTELDPIPAAIDEPRVIGVENPQTERLPLLNPGGVNGTRGPR